MTRKEYQILLAKANIEMYKVMNFLEKNKDAFDMMDLKLHEVSYYECTDMEKDYPLCYKNKARDYFYLFCDTSYEAFVVYLLEEHGITFNDLRHQVGRTSKFYLQDFIDKSVINTLYSLLTEVGYWYYRDYIDLSDDNLNRISPFDFENDNMDYFETHIEVLEYIVEEFFDDVKSHCEPIITTYNYIKDFKDNQVEYFKEFLEGFEEELEYEEEEKNKVVDAMLSNLKDIQSRYGILDCDMDIIIRLSQSLSNYQF